MPARKPKPTDEKPQFERFVETVRKVGADETDEALERAIEKIAPPKGDKLKVHRSRLKN
jgi:hypothetical protein